MTIDEAIKELSFLAYQSNSIQDVNLTDALRLGIEALKAVKECRASHMFCPGIVMEGETED